jgi:hypothetical protein
MLEVVVVILICIWYLYTQRTLSHGAGAGKVLVGSSRVYGGAQSPPDRFVSRADALESYPWLRKTMTRDLAHNAFAAVARYQLKFVSELYRVWNMELEPGQLYYYGPLDSDGVPTNSSPGNSELTDGKPLLIEIAEGDYYKMNWLSDWFNEQCRVKARRYDEPMSPIEYWEIHKEEIVDKVIMDRARGSTANRVSIRGIADEIYRRVLGCSAFRPGLMAGWIRTVGARRVLDFSAGWGDRLIGAIAAGTLESSGGVSYTGIDPNTCNRPGYEEIIREFAADSRGDSYQIITSPAETAEIAGMYDLVFTSPPYFDLEIYSDQPTQSSAYGTVDRWLDGFMRPTLDKVWAALVPGGHLMININNTKGRADYVQAMRRYANGLSGSIDYGVISYAERAGGKTGAGRAGKPAGWKSPQPIWIWKKEIPAWIAGETRTFPRGDIAGGQLVVDNTTYPRFAEGAASGYLESREACQGLFGRYKYLGAVAGEERLGNLPMVYYHVVEKLDSPGAELSPEVVLESIKTSRGVGVVVVRDDLLPGGTEQRAVGILEKIRAPRIVYPWNGFAQVALAIGCGRLGKEAIVVTNRVDCKANLRARAHGARHIIVRGDLQDIQAYAESMKDEHTHVMSFGFDTAEFSDELAEKIRTAVAGAKLDGSPFDFAGRTFWVVGGSATLLSVLCRVFAGNKFCVVQAGQKICPDQLEALRAVCAGVTLYESAEPYDANLWAPVDAHAGPGDVVWNVAEHDRSHFPPL